MNSSKKCIKPKLLVILGPTATGKSDLAVRLAREFDGEVISADSRQVYRGLNIGTGKITKKESRGIHHHLLNVADPKKRFTVVKYVKLAEQAIQDILNRGKLPIICGGTGFYIEALVDGIILPDVPANNALRKRLSGKTAPELMRLLIKSDPERARSIDKLNRRRIIRAIEIADVLGKVPQIKKTDKYEALFIGLNLPPDDMKERIRKRLFKRLQHGMIDEVSKLHSNGLSWKRMDELGLEYRYLSRFLQGKITREEMVANLYMEIWHYAKRQMTWFRKDKRIRWFDPDDKIKLARI